MDHLQTTVK